MKNALIFLHRKQKKIVGCFSILFLCTNLQSSFAQDSSFLKKLRIDPSSAIGGPAGQYIDKINFINLESSPKSAFGSISQLEVSDKYFIILDSETQAILIFTKQGKFNAKIESKSLGKNYSLFIFYIDKKLNLIKIPFGPNIFYFDMNGKLLKKSTVKVWLGIQGDLDNETLAYYNYNVDRRSPKDSIAYELTVIKKEKVVKQYLPYNVKYAPIQSQDILSSNHFNFYPDEEGSDKAVYYLRAYNYNVYKLTSNALLIPYQFIFPLQNSLPKNFATDTALNKKRMLYVNQNPNVIFRLANFYKIKNTVFFKLAAGNASLHQSYAYNTQSQKLISIDKIVSDSTTYFLPVTDAEVGLLDFTNYGLFHFDGTNFYSSYSSLVLFNQRDATRNKHINYPPELLKYFSDPKNKKGNPVLVQIHFKPTL